jgi:hypothetical protein
VQADWKGWPNENREEVGCLRWRWAAARPHAISDLDGRRGPGGGTVPHLAKVKGARDDPAFQQAYWRAFDKTFGGQNAQMVKSMLLSKVKKADTGDAEIDRVCLGLRMTMGWLAEAIERTALHDAGYENSEEESPRKKIAT